MKKKIQSTARQEGLFGNALDCPEVANLPLILEPQGHIEVFAPGSVYQPLLLSPKADNIAVGPGTLDGNEEAFIRDLIRYLYPAGNHPKSEKTPLAWGRRKIWLKRNIDKEPRSFRLRVDDSYWFYPDFIVWIMDDETRTQTFGFVDPKGLRLGTGQGWGDYKLVSTLYMPHVIGQKLENTGYPLIWEHEEWTFRLRGLLVSSTPLQEMKNQAKLYVRNESGVDASPEEADFNRARIVFPKDKTAYIETVLNLLTEDNDLDKLLRDAALAYQRNNNFVPHDEAGYDLALRVRAFQGSESEFVANLIKDYLKPDANGKLGTWAQNQRRLQLMDYAKTGLFGLGEEKVPFFRDHPTPCEELWKRMSANF